MNREFKVGDRVRVTELDNDDIKYNVKLNRTYTVNSVNPTGIYTKDITGKGLSLDGYFLLNAQIELVEDEDISVELSNEVKLTHKLSIKGQEFELLHSEAKQLKTILEAIL